jgi:predicted nucleotidyltransferase component of viral defense system
MIPRRYIQEWKEFAPWPDDAQIEQDLVIERALVEIFSDEFLSEHLAFRGGTALHKLFLKPQVRYSEDIDLVQIKPGPIKPILEQLGKKLIFLGTKRTTKPRAHNNTVVYKFETETAPVIAMKLKIEINCKEHFTVMGLQKVPFEVKNGWFSGKCEINTYQIEELLGTKMIALYQRRKGRDLFDLEYALANTKVDASKLVNCYKKYMAFSVAVPPTQKMYIINLEEKMQDGEFMNDIYTILRPGIEYDNVNAYEDVKTELLEKI